MPRRKISEYRAKKLVSHVLGLDYSGWSDKDLDDVEPNGTYVVKVDQAVKKRFKSGLIGINLTKPQLRTWIKSTRKKGFHHFIIEPYYEHVTKSERYLSLYQSDDGVHFSYSRHGGVDIEDNQASVKDVLIDDKTEWGVISRETKLTREQLDSLCTLFVEKHFTLLEINPYIVVAENIRILDVAIEVDDAAAYLVDAWTADDVRHAPRKLTEEEEAIVELNGSSSASFTFQIINSNGSLFMLLSGGGASVTVCDEVYSMGHGNKLASYGEYSGNPTEDETYIYAAAVLQALLKSKSKKKVLFIGGAIANFTDIAKTFAGVIRAIHDYGEQLQKEDVRVVVRRGGPNQEIGLKNIQSALDRYTLSSSVYTQETTIDEAVGRVIQEMA